MVRFMERTGQGDGAVGPDADRSVIAEAEHGEMPRYDTVVRVTFALLVVAACDRTPPEPRPAAPRPVAVDAATAAPTVAVDAEIARHAPPPGASDEHPVLTGECRGDDCAPGPIAPGGDLQAQIEAAKASAATVRVGGGGAATGTLALEVATTESATSLTADAVATKIRGAYQAGMRRCYQEALKRSPTLAGKVGLSFEVNESGRLPGPDASGFDPGVDTCLEGQMKNWTFTRPEDTDGNPTTASFTLALVLSPR
jgi:hypothetical protein